MRVTDTKISRVLILLLCSFLILLFNKKNMAQSQETETVELPELCTMSKHLQAILDSLVARESKCHYFKKSLIWTITISEQQEDKYAIKVTMVSSMQVLKTGNYSKPFGYFYLGDILFEVEGVYVESLFKICKNKKQFTLKKRKMPCLEDYSMWFYDYENGEITLKEAYPLDCK